MLGMKENAGNEKMFVCKEGRNERKCWVGRKEVSKERKNENVDAGRNNE